MEVKSVVTEVPSNNEILGISLADEIHNLFDYKTGDVDDDAFAIALLFLLESFYTKYNSKSLDYISSNYESDLDDLEKRLNRKSEEGLNSLFQTQEETTMKELGVPESNYSKVKNPNSPKTVITAVTDTIKAFINQLRDDIRVKLSVWKADVGKKASDFKITANLQRAVKRLKTTIKYSTFAVKQKAQRGIFKVAYGEEALYKWVCYGPNPCEWCLKNQASSPRKVDEWELDHPNGHCGLEVVKEKFIDDFNELVGGVDDD